MFHFCSVISGQKCNSYFCVMIGTCVDIKCASHSGVSSQWQAMLSNAYEQKCKVLMAVGHYTSSIHFARLSAVLDPGTFTFGLICFTKIFVHVAVFLLVHFMLLLR